MTQHAIKTMFEAHVFDISTGMNIIIMNEDEAHENDVFIGDRVLVQKEGKQAIAYVDVSNSVVKHGEVILFADIAEKLDARHGDMLTLAGTEIPGSIEFIKKKMDGGYLKENEIQAVIGELMENKLTEVELASFITSLYIRGLSTEETVGLTKAIVNSGKTLDMKGAHPIVDKHCTGGVAGNRTTMVIVPIIAAAGMYMPKTSSRAITSASGTADTMEVLAKVDFSLDEMRDIVLKTHGCITWGGGMNLASADDKLIKIRQPLRLDPKGVMVASVLAKKKSVGADYVVIDIPVGRGAKIPSIDMANDLAKEFIIIGSKLGMKVEVFVTYGRDPVGEGIGPGLECVDVLKTLQGGGPADLKEKSCKLAGAVLELCGKVEAGRGYAVAIELLQNGKAWEKMKDIIEAQGGDRNVKIEDMPIGQYKQEFTAEVDGRIHLVDNKLVNHIARAAGAPKSKGAGVRLHVESGDKVKKGQVLYEIIAESESKLSFAIELAQDSNPIELESMLLGRMGDRQVLEWKPDREK